MERFPESVIADLKSQLRRTFTRMTLLSTVLLILHNTDQCSLNLQQFRSRLRFYVVKYCLSCAGVKPVLFSDWEKIDSVETSRGEAAGKPREKLLTVEEMLQVAHK